MLRALLLGAARGMQRVGEQEEGRGQVRLLGAEHASLTAAIGVASEVDAAGQHCSYLCDGVLQARTVDGGVAGAGRAKRTRLAKWQIAAEDGEARRGKGLGQGAEEWCLGVRSGAVSEDHAILVGSFRNVQESTNVWIDGGVGELEDGGQRQGMILNRVGGWRVMVYQTAWADRLPAPG